MNANNGGMAVAVAENSASAHELRRSLSWVDVFFVASGVQALVLFSVGALADQVGTPSCLVWLASVMMGFSQAFTYAEISGLFPDKAGGASVYGSIAWLPYSKFIAPQKSPQCLSRSARMEASFCLVGTCQFIACFYFS